MTICDDDDGNVATSSFGGILVSDNQNNNDEASDDEDVEIANYYSNNMEGYTPLNNFNMNDLIMMNDSDTDSITTSDAEDDDDEDSSCSEIQKNVVPVNFHSLAEQALQVLDNEHLSMLKKDNCDLNITSIPHSNDEGNDTIDIDNVRANMQIDEEEICKPSKPFAMSTTEPSLLSSSLATNTIPSLSKPVDINAIQKAMQSIRLKSPTLATTLDAGASSSMAALANTTHAATNIALNHIIDVQFSPRQQKNQLQQHCYSTHNIIPSGPLSAFRRATSKAQMASANLSRSATLSEAVLRTWPIISFQRKMRGVIDQSLLLPQQQQQQVVNRQLKTFTIHILGADGVECTSLESVHKSVGPFVRWFDAALSSGVLSESNYIDTLLIEFSGPNISTTLVGQNLDILSQQSKKSCASSSANSRLIMATATFQPRQYHEIQRSTNNDTTPIADIAIAFNAGIWGYDSWKPTILSLINTPSPVTGNGKTMFVITSYTMEECEDDADVIVDVVKEFLSTKMPPHATTTSIIARQLWSKNIIHFHHGSKDILNRPHLVESTLRIVPGKLGCWDEWIEQLIYAFDEVEKR
jgi:hypothetical protein